MLSEINEFGFPLSLKRLEILQTISREHELRKLGKVVRTSSELLCIPSTPLGLHKTVHDADGNHPMARIHQTIPTRKGVFKIYPPGSEIGNRIGQVDIPPFSQIKGILRLPPEPAGLSLQSSDGLWQQSPSLKPSEAKLEPRINIELRPLNSGIGTDYFFVEPNNLMQLDEWYDERADLYSGPEIRAYIFKAFVPWLVIVTYEGNLALRDSQPGLSSCPS